MKKNDYELDSKSSLFTHKMVKPEPDRYVEALAEQSSRLKIVAFVLIFPERGFSQAITKTLRLE